MKDGYLDGFVFPVPSRHLSLYQSIATRVAELWCAYGAIGYHEFLGDALFWPGTLSFKDKIEHSEDETLIFGWVLFPSKAIRNEAHDKIAKDDSIQQLVADLIKPDVMIFNAKRMYFGGFSPFINISKK